MTLLNATSREIALADLHDHEKVIEQGLATFMEVGWALLRIRDDKKYKAAGFSTFEHYCLRRWHLSGRRARQLMDAADTVGELESGTTVPISEAQVRPLTAIRDDPDQVREAWAEAVEEAASEGREQPTAKHVERAVAKRQPARREHPAPFSNPILDRVAELVEGAGVVLDPFAGTGRVH